MPLTPRARAYLSTLRRRPSVPASEVVAAIERTGCTAYPAWIEFHREYAGYEEPLGREVAVFGVVHRDSHWLTPGEAAVDLEDDGRYSVACAEVHPSFDFRLYEDGSFHSFGGGGPCTSFDVKIEQNAVFSEAVRDGRSWAREHGLSRVPPGGLDALRAAAGAEIVGEASDRFASVWRGPDAVWLEGRALGDRVQLWVAADARDRIRAVLGLG